MNNEAKREGFLKWLKESEFRDRPDVAAAAWMACAARKDAEIAQLREENADLCAVRIKLANANATNDEIRALLAAEPPAGDEVEVVGYARMNEAGTRLQRWDGLIMVSPNGDSYYNVPLMTVRQHEAILASALAAK